MIGLLMATAVTPGAFQGSVEGWAPIIKMFSALLIVLGVMGLLTYLIKRYYPGMRNARGARPVIHVLGTVYLGSKRSIALIGVGNKQLVVGMTPSSMTLLASLKEDEVSSPLEWAGNKEKQPLSFSKIYQFLKKAERVS